MIEQNKDLEFDAPDYAKGGATTTISKPVFDADGVEHEVKLDFEAQSPYVTVSIDGKFACSIDYYDQFGENLRVLIHLLKMFGPTLFMCEYGALIGCREYEVVIEVEVEKDGYDISISADDGDVEVTVSCDTGKKIKVSSSFAYNMSNEDSFDGVSALNDAVSKVLKANAALDSIQG